MKLLFRAATALALLGLASPAFPCGEKKTTTATATDAKAKTTAVAKAEKKAQPKTAQAPSEKPVKAAN
ncbi:hypothetical protein AnaeK_3381 [Anaeromyxobacter sp. K]|uniref:Lipoprotein n=1 Tax=Anaeromyxobacter dehalogenans (strain ATCC BAA-258 / DSM 21875 / 2CP-1) TaxID=455488 RepID=B8J5B3_ANAD2|nr:MULTISPECIES: hypothetical protein [Anaeromyxobacter]ACG74595.1 hypothetical protein AnaeK_3381 [Anaeromyxobacter sp. K]ACL66775.1 conserved hypothetical protein [Anaeromyxobacter dehalogenans 2CP-1]